MDSCAVHGKNHDATTMIMVGHMPFLRRYARSLTQNAADADDLVQTCLMRAIIKIDSFTEGTNLRAWLLTILHNSFIDNFRHKRRAQEAFDTSETMQMGLFTPENQFCRIQVTEVEKALAALPAKQRSTLLLIALDDLSYEDVARITEVPVGTVRSRLSRARHTLIDQIEGTTIEDREAIRPEANIRFPMAPTRGPIPLKLPTQGLTKPSTNYRPIASLVA